MIDWHAKVVELKAMADEMELWAAKVDGHVKLVLGRNADELRRFAHQIELELIPQSEVAAHGAPPGWVTGEEEFPPDEAAMPSADQEQSSDQAEPGEDTNPPLG